MRKSSFLIDVLQIISSAVLAATWDPGSMPGDIKNSLRTTAPSLIVKMIPTKLAEKPRKIVIVGELTLTSILQ